MKSKHLSCVIHADPDRVYDLVVDPDSLPKWAKGLASAQITRDGDDLLVDSPMGQVRVRFVARNQFGVADHHVTLPSGTVINNPLRVLAHPEGSEVLFTVRQLELTDDEFEHDCAMVAADLERLRLLIESQ